MVEIRDRGLFRICYSDDKLLFYINCSYLKFILYMDN